MRERGSGTLSSQWTDEVAVDGQITPVEGPRRRVMTTKPPSNAVAMWPRRARNNTAGLARNLDSDPKPRERPDALGSASGPSLWFGGDAPAFLDW